MKNALLIICSFAFVMLFAGMTASAQTVSMYYSGPDSDSSGGVYTYPYYFNINSSAESYPLLCDDFTHEITPTDTWSATTLDVSNLNSNNVTGLEFGYAGVTGYLEASYLFEEEVTAYASNTDPEGLYNWAVWYLLRPSAVTSSSYWASLSSADQNQILDDVNSVEALGSSLTPSQFGNVVIYTPSPLNNMSMSGPQEFMGYSSPVAPVPEPSTLALLGIGAVGLLARRR
jgi:hypothetical protein